MGLVIMTANLHQPVSLYEFGGSEELVRRICHRFLPQFQSCKHVLDLGCGRGTFLELLKEKGIYATGVDNAQEAVDACRAKGLLTVVKDDILSFLSDKVDAYDGIFCSHVIEHLKYEDGLRLLQLCYRALRAGGTLVAVTPNCSDLQVLGEIFWLDPTHVRFYPQALLERMAALLGYERIKSGSMLGSWRAIPRRTIPLYLLRRLLLGKYYGKRNTYLVGHKPSLSE